MWKYLIGLLVILTLLLGAPILVGADTSQDVTITATGYVCGAPEGLTLIYISDYEIGISWTKGADAENTMVRAAIGRLPESRTDGYLVYYGNGTNATDWTANLGTIDARIYYRAWSQSFSGTWEEAGVSDWLTGGGMLIAFMVLSLGLTIVAFWRNNMPIATVAGIAWLGLFVADFTGHGMTGDYWVFTMVFLTMALICFLYIPIIGNKSKKRAIKEAKRLKKERTVYDEIYQEQKEIRENVRKLRGR